MPDRPRGRGAASVHTAVIAALVSAAVVGAGYGLQRALLRAPLDGELVAARVDQALLRYRFVRSTIHVAGERARRAECYEGWYRRPNRRTYSRGAQILFSDGERLEVSAVGVKRIAAGATATRMPPFAEVELAGCARALTSRIYARLVGHRRTRAVPADFMGRPALVLHLRLPRDRIDLFVQPRSLVPLGLRVETKHAVGWSVVDPVRPLTGPVKRDFVRRFDGS